MTAEPDHVVPFLPDYLRAYGDCRWELTEVPGLRMNDAFIAAPRPGEDRERWLSAMRGYRERIRAGSEPQRAQIVFDGRMGGVRLVFDAARVLGLRPGDRLTVCLEARVVSGSVASKVGFDRADPEDERERGRSETTTALRVIPDGEWHRSEVSVVVPEGAAGPGETSVVQPFLELATEAVQAAGESGRAELAGSTARLEIRRIEVAPAIPRYSGAAWSAALRSRRTFATYERPDLRWASRVFTCHFTFLYDRSIHDPRKGWQVSRFLRDGERAFGGYDAVVLWHSYPRIGIDQRNQFDHYRDMPGGLPALRRVAGRFHERGVRVFIAYNPWDLGTRREGKPDEEALAEIVGAIDADGIFLDTMLSAPASLRSLIDGVRPGVVFAPEGNPSVDQLAACNLSWGQWLHDPHPPGALRSKWIEPRHVQHLIRRWDTARQGEIEAAFFNGTGILIWENVFGVSNPWSAGDARLWKRCAAILRAFADAFSSPDWEPFVPALQPGVFAHRWPGDGFALYTLRNTGSALREAPLIALPEVAPGVEVVDLWNDRPARVVRDAGPVKVVADLDTVGCLLIAARGDARAAAVLRAQRRIRREPLVPRGNAAASVVAPRPVARARPGRRGRLPSGMLPVPGARVRMKLAHQRRECGCYPDPGTPPSREKEFLWGSPHEDSLEHDYVVDLRPFLVDEAPVSNAEYRRFLERTGYRPRDAARFLAHWDSGVMPDRIADLPVVFVDLDDARAYARWAGKRLLTEQEWQLAAQGLDGREWPWGPAFDVRRCAPAGAGPAPVRSFPEGRSPFGCYHMSGNVWEWTESERDDRHTRWAIVRGGSWFRPAGSLWYVKGGPQPCTSHTKLILHSPGLDRSATIGFRCAADVAP